MQVARDAGALVLLRGDEPAHAGVDHVLLRRAAAFDSTSSCAVRSAHTLFELAVRLLQRHLGSRCDRQVARDLREAESCAVAEAAS